VLDRVSRVHRLQRLQNRLPVRVVDTEHVTQNQGLSTNLDLQRSKLIIEVSPQLTQIITARHSWRTISFKTDSGPSTYGGGRRSAGTRPRSNDTGYAGAKPLPPPRTKTPGRATEQSTRRAACRAPSGTSHGSACRRTNQSPAKSPHPGAGSPSGRGNRS